MTFAGDPVAMSQQVGVALGQCQNDAVGERGRRPRGARGRGL
jgi:hypothetical protein